LTDRILVTGMVDTAVAGNYQLTYSVTDNHGKTTTEVRNVLVEEVEEVED
jgi:hypothetical protein